MTKRKKRVVSHTIALTIEVGYIIHRHKQVRIKSIKIKLVVNIVQNNIVQNQ